MYEASELQEVWRSADGVIHARVPCPACDKLTEIEFDQFDLSREVAVSRSGQILWDDDIMQMFYKQARERCPCLRKRKPPTEQERRASLRHIQRLLGHRSLESTQVYLRVEVSDLKRELKRCHPRERVHVVEAQGVVPDGGAQWN